jgi:hypothetical protein
MGDSVAVAGRPDTPEGGGSLLDNTVLLHGFRAGGWRQIVT